MSSENFNQSVGCSEQIFMKSISNLPIKREACAGALELPMAVPIF